MTAILGASLAYAPTIGAPWQGGATFVTNATKSAPGVSDLTGAPAERDVMTNVVMGFGAGLYLPIVAVSYLGRRRREAIESSLPDALDLLSVCVESGLGIDVALQRVAAGMRRSAPVLCGELELTNLQIKLGRPRKEALLEIYVRTGVGDTRTLATTIIQAERFGANLTSALRAQSDTLRKRRRHLAEERAAKVPVKLVLPLVVFFLPGVLVIAGGPALLTIQKRLAGGFTEAISDRPETDQSPEDAPTDPRPSDEEPPRWGLIPPARVDGARAENLPRGGEPETPG
ncbi:MAG: type II secretion system F family protein [Singulisphaera sp.]